MPITVYMKPHPPRVRTEVFLLPAETREISWHFGSFCFLVKSKLDWCSLGGNSIRIARIMFWNNVFFLPTTRVTSLRDIAGNFINVDVDVDGCGHNMSPLATVALQKDRSIIWRFSIAPSSSIV